MKPTEDFDRKRFIRKVAAFIYAMAVLGQDDGSVHVYFDEIEEHFGADFFPQEWSKDISLLTDIQSELCEYKGCDGNPDTCWLDVNGYDEYGDVCDNKVDRDGFNMCLFTDYIASDYDAD